MKEQFIEGRDGNELVVVLHGLRGSPQGMQGVCDAVRDARPDADVLALPLAFGGFFGMFAVRPAEYVAADVVERIDAAIEARARSGKEGSYGSIILVGHSFGAVIARKVAIIAHGELPDAVFEPRIERFRHGREWASKIVRIVMLGGMSRGWLPSAARNWTTATAWSIGAWGGELLAVFTFGLVRPTIAGIRQGAPFIVQTRLQWLALIRSHVRKLPIFVVQLLGAADDLVAPDDSVDFYCDVGGTQNSFALVELPFTTHDNAYVMSPPTARQRKTIEDAIDAGTLSDTCMHYGVLHQKQSLVFRRRASLIEQTKWHLFQRVVLETWDELKNIRVQPHHMTDSLAPEDKLATTVVFVIHGIRDRGFWTQKIARVIKQEVDKENCGKNPERQQHFRSFTGSYGYFALVPFVLPWIRRWKAEWLMDRYVEARARYPRAVVSFVGHSNGTYLLARALKDYPAARFHRAVLAGSVMRRDFDWITRLTRQCSQEHPQVEEVLNYVATGDWVVGILSKAFQPARLLFDIGSAGHDGFDQYRSKPHTRLHESHFVSGAHSAALVETQWDDIARFVIRGGPVPGLPDADFRPKRSLAIVALGKVSTVLLALFLWIVIGFGIALLKSVFGDGVFAVLPTVAPGQGLQCGTGALAAFCEWLAPVGRGILAGYNWVATHFPGRISAQGVMSQYVWLRAAVAAFYWWIVYIVASRF